MVTDVSFIKATRREAYTTATLWTTKSTLANIITQGKTASITTLGALKKKLTTSTRRLQTEYWACLGEGGTPTTYLLRSTM